MRFTDPGTLAVLRKASRGPAAIALRQARIGPNASVYPVNRAAALLVRGGSVGVMRRRPTQLGALGASSTTAAAGGAAASYGASTGTAALATYIGAGSIGGPVGMVIGAIVGIVVTKILSKQYLDVTSANNIANASVAVFKQYQQIAGQVAGRQVGLPAMEAIWKGALYSGLFAKNNQQLCFHNGCLKYRGQPEWITATIHGPDNAFTLGTAYANFLRGTARAASPVMAGTQLIRSGGGFRGLGAVNGVPEAVVLVDQYLVPANTHDSPAWLVPSSALEQQILYDVADAWLAANHPDVDTTPYLLSAPQPADTFAPQPPTGAALAPPPAASPFAPVASGPFSASTAVAVVPAQGGGSALYSTAPTPPGPTAAAPAAASGPSMLPLLIAGAVALMQ